MRRGAWATAAVLAAVVVFCAGAWVGHRFSGGGATGGARKVVAWIDPMHPAYRSDRPGVAPDCGMQLEPVYEDGGAPSGQTVPASAAKVTPEHRQMIGVKLAAVEKGAGERRLRTLGRVVVDETRVYRVTAAGEGSLRDVSPVTVGARVARDQVLATFFAREFLAAQQAYIYNLGALDRFASAGNETPEQIELTKVNVQSAREGLENLGMSAKQADEVARSRQIAKRIWIVSPSDAFVVARNVSAGQRFEKGMELYRLADLSHVWVLADLFGREAGEVRPGEAATVSIPSRGTTLRARVSEVPPQFEPSSRTMKVRLEVENQGLVLRPEMFVDVEFAVRQAPAVTVPLDAVLDSGLRQTVYVESGPGVFTPRKVRTGRSLGERVEILEGLEPGEKIVVSGNFLVDSESRMRAAAAGLGEETAKDPVCLMDVDEPKARGAGRTATFRGVSFFFCSDACRKSFEADPSRHAGEAKGGGPGHG